MGGTTVAVVEGEVCGDWLMTTVRRAALDMEQAQLSVSVAKLLPYATEHGGEHVPHDCCAFRANRSQPEFQHVTLRPHLSTRAQTGSA